MALDGAILEIDADINGGTVTGVFEIKGNISIQETVRPNYKVEDFGEVPAKVAREAGILDGPTRRGYNVDIGAGEHTFEIDFLGWEGSGKAWGDVNGDAGEAAYDATNDDAVQQIHVFMRFLQFGTTDSVNPARLFVGEYNDVSAQTHTSLGTDGDWSAEAPLSVQVDFQRGTAVAEDGGTRSFNGTINCTEILDLNETIDAVNKVDF